MCTIDNAKKRKRSVERWTMAAVIGMLPSVFAVIIYPGTIPIIGLAYLSGFLYFKILHY